MSPSRSQHEPARASQRRSAMAGFALALALLVAQTLGLWHRTAHAPVAGHHAAALAHDGHAAGIPSAGEHSSLTAHVFGHEAEESASCRVFDQQTLADSLLAVVVVLPVFEPVRGDFVSLDEGVARSASTPYQARAPPSVRARA